MPAPDIILPKPYVLVEETGSQVGGVIEDSSINFGQISLVYDTSDTYSAGDYVLYITDGQIRVIYGADKYVLIKEDRILNKEEIIP